MGEAALVAPETQNYSRAGLRPGPGSGVVGLGNAGDVSHGKIRLRLINRTVSNLTGATSENRR